MPKLSALLGVATLKDALRFWKENESNSSEEFWQKAISDRTYVLSQIFSYPVVIIGTKAYVGGKQISNSGGREVDFLATTESTDAVILIEIKTPQTKLLARPYREGAHPLSMELSGALAQVLKYRQSITQAFDSLSAGSSRRLTLGEPRCIVIAGNCKELANRDMRESFELMRERLQGIIVVTYDELFVRVERLLALLELN